MAAHLCRAFRLIACSILLLGLVPGGIQEAAAAACPNEGTTSAPTVPGPPTGLPDTGAGGGVDFCAQNPDQCQSTADGAETGASGTSVSDDLPPSVAFASFGLYANRGPS